MMDQDRPIYFDHVRWRNGMPVGRASNVGVFEVPPLWRRQRRRGTLYVLVDLGGDPVGRDEVARELVETIGETYIEQPGSVTYALRQALLLGNARLLRYNARFALGERRVAGGACVVWRDGELFLALWGDVRAYLVHRGKVTVFPIDPTPEERDASVMGVRQVMVPWMYRRTVAPGMRLLVLEGELAERAQDEEIAAILERCERPAWALEVADATAANFGTALWFEVESESVGGEEPKPWPAVTEAVEGAEEVRAPVVSAPRSPVKRSERRRPSVPPPVETRPVGPRWNERVMEGARRVWDRLRAWGRALLPEPRPVAAYPVDRRKRRRRSRVPYPWLRVAAIAIPVIAALIVLALYLRKGVLEDQAYQERMAMALEKREAALANVSNPSVARDYWLEVLVLVDQVEEIRPAQPTPEVLREEAYQAIDQLDRTVRFPWLKVLWPREKSVEEVLKLAPEVFPWALPRRILVNGSQLYVADVQLGGVKAFTLAPSFEAIEDEQDLLVQGDEVDGMAAQGVLDMVWEQRGRTFLVLTTEGRLLRYDLQRPGYWEVVPLPGVEQWRTPVAIGTFDIGDGTSYFYVLDPGVGQILRYSPVDGGYDGPEPWLQGVAVDLSGAIDMGINGNIYVLYSSGRLERLYMGERKPLSPSRLSVPLRAVSSLYTGVDEITPYIYVADPEEGRIVQYDKEGRFLRQFCPAREVEEVLKQVVAVDVDERGGRIYFATPRGLFVATFPPLEVEGERVP